ncbi:hypothetical protein [Flavobacterium sp.]|uniref:hypothetical protein n=1 Tax=Flavobacterium sp. TaxID=239 RepID=UPI00262FD4DB|nr:hypothetical protein [Flavobacterium sp.]
MRSIILFLLVCSVGYSQREADKRTICLNADTTMNNVLYTVWKNPNAHTIYRRTLKWIADYYGKRPNIVVDSVSNKMIRIQANNPLIFFRPMENDTTNVERYGENYIIEMNIENGIYYVNYSHLFFTMGGNKVDLRLSDVYNDNRNLPDDDWPDTRTQYETSIGAFLFRIYDAVSDPSFKFD